MKRQTVKKRTIIWKRVILSAAAVALFGGIALAAPSVSAVSSASSQGVSFSNGATGRYQCGSGNNRVNVAINIGCYGSNGHCSNQDGCSAIMDAAFAIIRALSAGVGVVVVASVVWAGVQYTMSRGDPNETAKALTRVRETLIALLVFIFGAALLDYLIPTGFFK
ncbi:MAG TPA: hypothetical protein VKQ34_04920 [Candidatus Saccharimonadales bacterium]|nr:hypothetical protein [Candidatus Saccharimonadales bacterium]